VVSRLAGLAPALAIASLAFLSPLAASAADKPGDLPPGFVDLSAAIPGIAFDLRYAGRNNFVGDPIDGYLRPRAILSHPAAAALGRVQDELRPFGLGLMIYDGYRPQRAVDHFVRWSRDLIDQRQKAEFYPAVDKTRLFELGYLAERSGHSRGSTVDLTLISLADGQPLDMGAAYDLFDPISWPADLTVPATARAHRLLLRTSMVRHGFRPYEQEWWHFTLVDEPFPETYFDFPIE
jgi:D-alanyl-D-alanine dipeptidase